MEKSATLNVARLSKGEGSDQTLTSEKIEFSSFEAGEILLAGLGGTDPDRQVVVMFGKTVFDGRRYSVHGRSIISHNV